jgi:hypothetical protein
VLARHPDRVIPWAGDIIVRAPLSTHPFASSQLRVDDQWILQYAKAVTDARKAGDPSLLAAFVDEWFRTADGEDGYFERLGVKRLRELMI